MATEEGSRPTSDPESPKATARVRRRGVRLWGMMALVAFAAFVMARTITRARAQREAVAVIKQAGGDVGYDYEYQIDSLLRLNFARGIDAKPWGPEWLRNALGQDYFRRVVFVSFPRERPDDLARIVGFLQRLEGLRFLYLTDVNDRDLGLLGGLDQVQGMHLSSYEITDAGLVKLEGLQTLRRLRLDGTQVSDEGTASLREAIPALAVSHSAAFPLMTTARKDRARRRSSEDWKKYGEDLKQWTKEYNSPAGPSGPLPPPPPLSPP
jgi:hypothetical protein